MQLPGGRTAIVHVPSLDLGGKCKPGVQTEVNNIAGCDMRADMLVQFEDGTATVVEVKTVVDTDYAPETAPSPEPGSKRKSCVFIGYGVPYERAGIFPWGQRTQRLHPAEAKSAKVVSTRAIKHLRELTAIANGDRKSEQLKNLSAAVLFVVARSDAKSFRVNHEACPELAKQAIRARDAGVKIVAQQVDFDVDANGEGFSAIDKGTLPVDWRFEDCIAASD
eukprot:scaffold47031_cov47-Prasinocladus_malaysianus.AAC.3